MKSKKITTEQLRSIIMSEVKKTKLHEMPGIKGGRAVGKPSQYESVHSAVEFAFQDAIDGLYDPADPVMSEYGEEKWYEQCMHATHVFTNEVAAIVDRICKQLHDGEFFQFTPNRGRF